MDKDQNTPGYIKQVPWYAQDSQGRGSGQFVNIAGFQPKGKLEQWYVRGGKTTQATSYRKGACQNCGGMGHSRKQCTQRPRKLGAKFTNKQIASDDVYKQKSVSWQIRQDRWNGYTPDMYNDVINDFNKFQEVKKKIKGEEDLMKASNPLAVANLPTSKVREKFQGLTENRNREVVAKYLLNLDPNAPEFQPKSRTLRGEYDYMKDLNNSEAVGQKAALQQQDRFASEQVQRHHAQINSTALPTLTQKIFKNVQQKKAGLNSGKMGELVRKYGNNQSMVLDVVEEEEEAGDYVARRQRVVRSSYEEDVYHNDHTSTWGSWYNKTLGWGYKCCYNTDKLSYCSGIKGRQRALAKQLRILTQRAKDQNKLKELEVDQIGNDKEEVLKEVEQE